MRRTQLDYAHPPHSAIANIDIVGAYEVQATVPVNAEVRESRRHMTECSAITDSETLDVRNRQQAAGRIDVEGARMDALSVDVLD